MVPGSSHPSFPCIPQLDLISEIPQLCKSDKAVYDVYSYVRVMAFSFVAVVLSGAPLTSMVCD